VGVDQCHPVAAGDVLADHRLQRRRLAGAGLAEDVDVTQPVSPLDAEELVPAAVVGACQAGDVGVARAPMPSRLARG
jgi:hypothetical protein